MVTSEWGYELDGSFYWLAIHKLQPNKAPSLSATTLSLTLGQSPKAGCFDFWIVIPGLQHSKSLLQSKVRSCSQAREVTDRSKELPTFLCCVSYKLMDKLILMQINEMVYPQMPCIQARFRSQNQVLHPAQDTKTTLGSGKKVGAVLIDLAATYDCVTSWTDCPAAASYFL